MLIITETPTTSTTSTPVPQWILDNAQDLARVIGLIEPLLTPRWNPAAAGAVVRIRRAVDELGRVAAELAHAGIKCEIPGQKDPDDSARLALANADLADRTAETSTLKVQLAELREETKAIIERREETKAHNAALAKRIDELSGIEAELTKARKDTASLEGKLQAAETSATDKAERITTLEADLAVAQRALEGHKNDAERIRLLEIEAAHVEKLRTENRRLKAKLADTAAPAAPMAPAKPPAITRSLALARFTELAKRFEEQAASVRSRDVNVAMRACAKALRAEITAAKGMTA